MKKILIALTISTSTLGMASTAMAQPVQTATAVQVAAPTVLAGTGLSAGAIAGGLAALVLLAAASGGGGDAVASSTSTPYP